jgi:hypothetical protein
MFFVRGGPHCPRVLGWPEIGDIELATPEIGIQGTLTAHGVLACDPSGRHVLAAGRRPTLLFTLGRGPRCHRLAGLDLWLVSGAREIADTNPGLLAGGIGGRGGAMGALVLGPVTAGPIGQARVQAGGITPKGRGQALPRSFSSIGRWTIALGRDGDLRGLRAAEHGPMIRGREIFARAGRRHRRLGPVARWTRQVDPGGLVEHRATPRRHFPARLQDGAQAHTAGYKRRE